MNMSCHILVANEKKKITLIKNWPRHQSISDIYTKLMETNRKTTGARFWNVVNARWKDTRAHNLLDIIAYGFPKYHVGYVCIEFIYFKGVATNHWFSRCD